MNEYIVLIKGIDAHKNSFTERLEVKAENENEAKVKANDLFMIPGSDGISHKYSDGPYGVTHFIEDVHLK
jgi:hypothetical protein